MLDSGEGCWHMNCPAMHTVQSELGEVLRSAIHFCRACRRIVTEGDGFGQRCPHCGHKESPQCQCRHCKGKK